MIYNGNWSIYCFIILDYMCITMIMYGIPLGNGVYMFDDVLQPILYCIM